METYAKYKDSGIEWIGEIPEHWEVKKIKNMGKISTSSVDKKVNKDEKIINLVNYMDIYKNEKKIIDNTIEFMKVSAKDSQIITNNLIKGDILFTPSSETSDDIGHSAVVMEDLPNTLQSYHILRLRFSQNFLDDNFKRFVFNNNFVLNQFSSKTTGTTRMTLSLKDFKETIFVLPPFQEQQKIAKYLDHKTQQINQIITKNEKLIELIKEKKTALINEVVTKGLDKSVVMKDSGVEWIGEIPEHWNIGKLKQIVNIKGRIGFRGYTVADLVEEGEGALTIGAKHLSKDNKLNLSDPEYLSWDKYYESPEIMIKKDDLIISQRGTLGKVIHINKDIGYATINPSMVLLKDITEKPEYCYYYLNSYFMNNIVKSLTSDTAVPMISQNQIGNFAIIKPPLQEQEQIVEYLDQKTKKIDTTIEKVNKEIILLKEYKESLINNVVTGKVKVSD